MVGPDLGSCWLLVADLLAALLDAGIAAARIASCVTEADKLIRQRLEEQNIDADHMLLAVTAEGAGIIRSSC